jgi:hypothetical protein
VLRGGVDRGVSAALPGPRRTQLRTRGLSDAVGERDGAPRRPVRAMVLCDGWARCAGGGLLGARPAPPWLGRADAPLPTRGLAAAVARGRPSLAGPALSGDGSGTRLGRRRQIWSTTTSLFPLEARIRRVRAGGDRSHRHAAARLEAGRTATREESDGVRVHPRPAQRHPHEEGGRGSQRPGGCVTGMSYIAGKLHLLSDGVLLSHLLIRVV